ncbi:hypothetical protein SPSYN_00821 [Sporotomaculum syntrophicum]|uniref:HPr kinase/phosphorylase n=1 Tax=Sporotomaculum syntrophicum TaxID=182264 RepID=A0A9D3AZP9_9FIRM|nr:hypothetical protein [Sporotomaculum syntrophicum]KAF1086083.1 hypothetical protein SPSYN_00821 [Sporotomaculum syntrophicum]
MHHYQLFGIRVRSEIYLPELLPAAFPQDQPEVAIILGTVPEKIANPVQKGVNYQIGKGQLIFHVRDVAGFYVSQGNRIVVEPSEGAPGKNVRLYLLGTAFGALLIQREILPLHGSAVAAHGQAVIFTGLSGAGKSSLLAAFRQKGYPFLTDDIVAITIAPDGSALVHPSYPQQKLWRDSTEAIGFETESLTPLYTEFGQDKFALPAHQSFWPSPLPLAAIYEIQATECREVTLQPLNSFDKLAVLLKNTYRPYLVDGLGLKAAHFKQCAEVSRLVAIARLIRPLKVFSLPEQVRCIEEDLKRHIVDKEVETV